MPHPLTPSAPQHPRHAPLRTAAQAGMLGLLVLTGAACSGRTAAPDAPVSSSAAPALPLEPLATLQDLMKLEVDASADPLWDAVGTVTTRQGTLEKRPHTDAEWEALRQHALILEEATNLLLIPGRRVAAVPFPSDGPGVLSSSEIQQRLDEHRPEFNGHVLALRAVVRRIHSAIDARDAAALQSLGEAMDAACEACHIENWYPHQVIPPLPEQPAVLR